MDKQWIFKEMVIASSALVLIKVGWQTVLTRIHFKDKWDCFVRRRCLTAVMAVHPTWSAHTFVCRLAYAPPPPPPQKAIAFWLHKWPKPLCLKSRRNVRTTSNNSAKRNWQQPDNLENRKLEGKSSHMNCLGWPTLDRHKVKHRVRQYGMIRTLFIEEIYYMWKSVYRLILGISFTKFTCSPQSVQVRWKNLIFLLRM